MKDRPRVEYHPPLVDLEQITRVGDLLPGYEGGAEGKEREFFDLWTRSENLKGIRELMVCLPYAEEVVSATVEVDTAYKEALVAAHTTFWDKYTDLRSDKLRKCEEGAPRRMEEIETSIPAILRQAVERHVAAGNEPTPRVALWLAGGELDPVALAQKGRWTTRLETVQLWLSDPQQAFLKMMDPWSYDQTKLEQRMLAMVGSEEIEVFRDVSVSADYLVAMVMKSLGRRLLHSGGEEYKIGEGEEGVWMSMRYFSARAFSKDDIFGESDFAFIDAAIDDETCAGLIDLTSEHSRLRWQQDNPHSVVDHEQLKVEVMGELLKTDGVLLWWHAERLLMATDAAIATGHVPMSLQQEMAEYRVIREADGWGETAAVRLSRVAVWYDRLIPQGAVTPLADRRGTSLPITGFSLSMFGPSNAEVGGMIGEILPDGIGVLDVRSLTYVDESRQKKTVIIDADDRPLWQVTQAHLGDCSEDNDIWVYDVSLQEGVKTIGEHREYRREMVRSALRHEGAHVWWHEMVKRYPGVVEVFANLFMTDTARGENIFLNKMSDYPMLALLALSPLRVLSEAVAELWKMAENEDFEKQLCQRGMDGEAEMLRCMRNEGYLQQVLERGDVAEWALLQVFSQETQEGNDEDG